MIDPTTDFSGSYRDPAANTEVDPAAGLFQELSAVAKSATTGAVAGAPVPNRQRELAPAASVGAGPTSKPGATAAPVAAPAAAGASAGVIDPKGPQSPEGISIMARIAPLGIKSLDDLRKKTDVELKKLSTDVVNYEMRQASLAKSFRKNVDGSYDFSTGPDGLPTGLGPDGKVLPPAGSTAAPAPTTPAATPPAAKPGTKKPGAKKTAPKKTAPKKNVVKPKGKPTSKPKAPTKKPPTRPSVVRRPAPKAGFRSGPLR